MLVFLHPFAISFAKCLLFFLHRCIWSGQEQIGTSNFHGYQSFLPSGHSDGGNLWAFFFQRSTYQVVVHESVVLDYYFARRPDCYRIFVFFLLSFSPLRVLALAAVHSCTAGKKLFVTEWLTFEPFPPGSVVRFRSWAPSFIDRSCFHGGLY